MNVIDTSLRRPVTVIICTLALFFFGCYVFTQMPQQKRPDTDFPIVSVTTTMSGANATVMDNDVADVLEDKLSGISDVKSITSSSYMGRSVTQVEFKLDKNINDAASDVRDKVSSAAGDLPDEADTPIVQKLDVNGDAILQLAITGDTAYKDKVYFVDKVLKTGLQAVNNVGSIGTAGYRDREIRIWVDPAALHARNLVMDDIATAVNKTHVELPAGSVLLDSSDVDLRVNAEYATVEELKALPVKVTDGTVVRLGDIAKVEDGLAEEENKAALNDDEAIIVDVKKQTGANEVKLCEDVLKKVESLKSRMPEGLKITTIYNQSDNVRSTLTGAQEDIMSAVLLCALLLYLFLQTFRATMVTVVTIPVCLMGSFIVMQKLDISLNTLSMMGITLSVGMVVDATTVVLDNVDKHLQLGENPMEATAKGAKEVAFSVIGGVLTTVAVFSPIAFMSGIVGRFFKAFGITVILTISLSLVLAMTLTPFLCSRLFKKTKLSKIGAWCSDRCSDMEKAYRGALTRAVNHRKATMLLAAGLFALGILFASIIGTSYFANDDDGTFQIKCELPSGTSLDETYRTLVEMGKVVRQNKNVKYTYCTVGNNSGFEKNCGTVYVQLIAHGKRPSVDQVKKQVRQQTAQFKDVITNYTSVSGKDVTMTLVGNDMKVMMPVAKQIMQEARAKEGITDVESDVRLDKPELDVKLNRGLTDTLNVNVRALSNELYAIFGGKKVGVFKDQGYRYDIRMMAPQAERRNLKSLSSVYARTGNGNIVQANNLFTIEEAKGPNVVKRYNRQKSLTISTNVTEDYSSGQAMSYLSEAAGKIIPKDSSMSLVATGMSESMGDDFKSLGISIIVAIALVYVIMAVQFESFIHPFTIMFSLPLMTPGAFGLLFLTGCKLDILSFMGLILLVGIVVNNGIILVDFINQERAKGASKRQAVINAGPMRLRAILITATSTLIGAVPAALKLTEGSEMRQSMSITIFGGLFTSTLLTLFVIPVVYLILDDAKDYYKEVLQPKILSYGAGFSQGGEDREPKR